MAEDEDAIRDFIVINLKRSGYEVFDAPNGKIAYEMFEENPTGFDVAILDIMMPEMDGFTLCKKIREKAFHRDHHAVGQNPGDGQGQRLDAGGG